MSDFTYEELTQIANPIKGAEKWNLNLLGKSIHGHRDLLDADEVAIRKLKAEIARLERAVQTRKEVILRLQEIASKK